MRFKSFSPVLLSALCFSLLTACGDDVDDNDLDDLDDDVELVVNCARLPDGSPCGDTTVSACNGADTCLGGVCVQNFVAPGTACGEASSGACDAADTCNGAGQCLSNHFPDGTACGEIVDTVCNPLDVCNGGVCQTRLAVAGTACGDPTATDCDGADTCDGAGSCQTNLASNGAPCGDPTDTTCNPADTCLAGACQQIFADVDTACGDATVTECNLADKCNAVGDCLPNFVDASTPCGDATVTECDLADTCDGSGACTVNYVTAGTPCGSATSNECDAPDTCSAGACLANSTDNGVICYDCAAGAGSCAACNSAVCDNRDQPVCEATGITTTTLSGNNHRGNMFTIIAKENVIIRSFDASPMGNTTMEIYTRPGSYAGFGGSSDGWTLLGTAPITYTGGLTRVDIPVNVEIRAGETQAFYVTSAVTGGTSLNYSNGTSEGAVYVEDANLQFTQGVGLEYPFSNGTGAFYTPRIWNGAIHYDVNNPLDSTGVTYDNVVAQGVMFDVDGIAKTDMGGILVELVAGTHDVDVYFRRGTFVGHEASSTGWELIGSLGAVSSPGGGALTRVSFADRIELEPAETIGFYIDTKAADQLRTTAGGAVGDVASTNGSATVHVGTAVGTTFTSGGAPAAVRAVIDTTPCVVTP